MDCVIKSIQTRVVFSLNPPCMICVGLMGWRGHQHFSLYLSLPGSSPSRHGFGWAAWALVGVGMVTSSPSFSSSLTGGPDTGHGPPAARRSLKERRQRPTHPNLGYFLFLFCFFYCSLLSVEATPMVAFTIYHCRLGNAGSKVQ